MDLEGIKQRTDILSLIGRDTNLHRVAKTNGGEYAGACPFCGGKDRFRVWPEEGKYWCRVCEAGSDVLDYVMQRDKVDLVEAARILGGDSVFQKTARQTDKLKNTSLYTEPAQDWQAAAHKAIAYCQELLHGPEGKAGLDYLHARGLNDQTIRYFQLGYAPRKLTGKNFTVWPGIVIPCIVAGHVWYIKVRSLATDPQPKYLLVKGSKPAALFNASDVNNTSPCVICEGEFNTMIAWQELQDVAAFVSPGGAAKNRLDLSIWGAYLAAPERLLSCFDQDAAGQSGARLLSEQLGAFNAPIPGAQDLNEFYLTGGNLWADWLQPALDKCDPMPERWEETIKGENEP